MATKKPKLGQNFLADQRAAQRIVDALGDIAQATVLEIGPGKGALTDLLVRSAGRLIAIELDRMLAVKLRMRYQKHSNVEVVEGDVLKIDLNTLLGPHTGSLADRQKLDLAKGRVVGNLPYYITSDILLRLFDFSHLLDVIVIMVQREVAERIAAKPGTRDYGLLSATAQLYCDVELLFTLPPGAFAPPPKVHSSVLRMKVRPKFADLGVPPREFIAFLKLAFAQKRKTLHNNLRGSYGDEAARTALAAAKLKSDIRAEAVSLEKMATLYKALPQKPDAARRISPS